VNENKTKKGKGSLAHENRSCLNTRQGRVSITEISGKKNLSRLTKGGVRKGPALSFWARGEKTRTRQRGKNIHAVQGLIGGVECGPYMKEDEKKGSNQMGKRT